MSEFLDYIKLLIEFNNTCKSEPKLSWERFKRRKYNESYAEKRLRENHLYEGTCKFCGKEFLSNKYGKVYCSEYCKQSKKQSDHIVTCQVCGVKFTTDRIDKMYCSNSCKSKAYYYRRKKNE